MRHKRSPDSCMVRYMADSPKMENINFQASDKTLWTQSQFTDYANAENQKYIELSIVCAVIALFNCYRVITFQLINDSGKEERAKRTVREWVTPLGQYHLLQRKYHRYHSFQTPVSLNTWKCPLLIRILLALLLSYFFSSISFVLNHTSFTKSFSSLRKNPTPKSGTAPPSPWVLRSVKPDSALANFLIMKKKTLSIWWMARSCSRRSWRGLVIFIRVCNHTSIASASSRCVYEKSVKKRVKQTEPQECK